jgi:hypothetical protein
MAAPAKDRLAAIERAGRCCQECGRAGTFEEGCWIDLEVDHILSEKDRGDHAPANLRVLCYPCHARRHGWKATGKPRYRKGRPPSLYRLPCRVRLSDEQESVIAGLAERWDCQQVDVIRRLILEAGEREAIS